MTKKIRKIYSLDTEVVKQLETEANNDNRPFSRQLEIIIKDWFASRKAKKKK